MAKISIKPSPARNAAREETSLARQLQSLESQVRSVRNGLRYKIAAREHIKSQLRAAEEQIRLERTRVSKMSSTLEQIVNLYTRNESTNSSTLKAKKANGQWTDDIFPWHIRPNPWIIFPVGPHIYPHLVPSFQDFFRKWWEEHHSPWAHFPQWGTIVPIQWGIINPVPIVAPLVGPGGLSIWGRLNEGADWVKEAADKLNNGVEAKAEAKTSGNVWGAEASVGDKEKGGYAQADARLGEYEASAEAKAHASMKDGVYASAGAAASGTIAAASASAGYHSDTVNADASVEASLLHGEASVNGKAQLIDGDGNFNPNISAKAEGSVYVAQAEGQASASVLDEFGINHEYKAEGKATVLGAEGEAKANMSFVNDKGEFEPSAEASAEGSAYVVKASGSIEASNDFGGIKVTGNAEVGVEGSVGFKAGDGKVTIKGGVTVFGGGEIEITVNYREIGKKTAQGAKSALKWIDSKMPWNW